MHPTLRYGESLEQWTIACEGPDIAHLYGSPRSLRNDWRVSHAADCPGSGRWTRPLLTIPNDSNVGASVPRTGPLITSGGSSSSRRILLSLEYFHLSLSVSPLITPLDGYSTHSIPFSLHHVFTRLSLSKDHSVPVSSWLLIVEIPYPE